jgi:hypothetical protein
MHLARKWFVLLPSSTENTDLNSLQTREDLSKMLADTSMSSTKRSQLVYGCPPKGLDIRAFVAYVLNDTINIEELCRATTAGSLST